MNLHTLIVVSHPEPGSLSHSVAARLGEGLLDADAGSSFEIADLAAEGFDPRFSAADLAVHRRQESPPADVVAEQRRIERAEALVLVYPVYWWSMPGLLKGWIDRVFSNGWAFDDLAGKPLVKKLRHLDVHLVAIAGADPRLFARHGYFGAMKTQIDHGIFDFCGAEVLTSELLMESESRDAAAHLNTARAVGGDVIRKSRRGEAVEAA